MQRRSQQVTIDDQLFDAVANNEMRRLKQIFKEHPDLDLITITNQQMETLLHIACQCSSLLVVELIIQYFEEKREASMLSNFIDMRNDEGFTCIHLASFAGKLVLQQHFKRIFLRIHSFLFFTSIQQIIEFLKYKGGQLNLVNAAGLTAMHTSAQGDQVPVMLYLKMQGLSIEQKDHNDRTPLHWSAYQSATNAVAFLLTWGARLEEQDSDNKMTALHYAVISGSALIVRKLLLAGANKEVKDNDNLTPLAHAQEKELDSIVTILSAKPGLSEACNLRQPFEKPRKKKRLLFFFAVMYLTSFLGSLFFVVPYVASFEAIIVFFSLSFLTLVFFLCAWLCDPGYLKQKQKSAERLLDLLRSVDDPASVCSKCEIIQPSRSKHCDVCGYCVKVHDHHCPWINNCVGAKNYKYFYGFILLVFVQMAFQIVFHSLYFTQTDPTDEYVFQIIDSRSVMEELHLATSIYCTVICLFFLVCVGILLLVQTKNLISGMTMHDKYGYKGHRHHHAAQNQVHQKQIDTTQREGQDAMNYSMASDAVSTMLENEQGVLLGLRKQADTKPATTWSNMIDICFRNNSNPRFNMEEGMSFNARGSLIQSH